MTKQIDTKHRYYDFANSLSAGDVCRTEMYGTVVWIKKISFSKQTIWHVLQKVCSTILRAPILRPTVLIAGGEVALKDQADRIRAYADSGFHVPEIIEQGTDFLVLSDLGVTLQMYLNTLQKTHKSQESEELLLRAACEIARLHNAGYAHGRPHLKDLVYDETRDLIGFLDLEENPLSVMPQECAYARDMWLFLCSAARYADEDEDLIKRLYQAYLTKRGLTAQPSIAGLVKLLAVPCKLVEMIAYKHVGKDVRHVIQVNKALAQ